MSAVATMLTTGVIACRTGQPIHRIEYVIRTRGIRPIGTAGVARVYSDESFEFIASELRRIDAARAAGKEVATCR